MMAQVFLFLPAGKTGDYQPLQGENFTLIWVPELAQTLRRRNDEAWLLGKRGHQVYLDMIFVAWHNMTAEFVRNSLSAARIPEKIAS